MRKWFCDIQVPYKSSLFLISWNEYFYFRFQLVAQSNGPAQRKLAPYDAAEQQIANTHSSVHFHCFPHPRSELVDIRVNSILVWQCAGLSPAHNACKHPAAVSIRHCTGQRSAAIVMACVSAAFFESSTQEVPSYRSIVRARKMTKQLIQILTFTFKDCNQTRPFLRPLTSRNCRHLSLPNLPRPLSTQETCFRSKMCDPSQ